MRDTQRKGDMAVTKGIYTFTAAGYDVSKPITESAAYDFIVDTGMGLYRVQARYWTRSRCGVDLRRVHSNSNGYVVKKTRPQAYDWLYILRDDGAEYLIKACLYGRRAVTPQESDRLLLQ